MEIDILEYMRDSTSIPVKGLLLIEINQGGVELGQLKQKKKQRQ